MTPLDLFVYLLVFGGGMFTAVLLIAFWTDGDRAAPRDDERRPW